jgi:hypothetical protein
LNPHIVFPSIKKISHEIFPNLEKNKRFLCFTIIFLMDVSYCFDLWMSKGVYDIFALVINFLDENWQPKKVTIGLFETTKIIGQALARNLK